MIESGNISFPHLEPTTSGLACSLRGVWRGDQRGILVSNQADHLITCVKLPVCDWAAARGSTLPGITTLPLVTLEWLRNMTFSLTIIDYPCDQKFSYDLKIVWFWLKVITIDLNWNLHLVTGWFDKFIWETWDPQLIQFSSLIKSP